jgi:Tol biopolymer transport system component
VAFNSSRRGSNDFFQRKLGSGEDVLIFESPDASKYLGDWSRDGKFLLYHNARTIFALPLTGEQKPTALLQTSFTKDAPHFSPDGRWVAYNSSDSGATEVFVASFPTFDDQRQVSLGGGGAARWRADSRELFYMSPEGRLMSVPIVTGRTTEFGAPRFLFQTPNQSPNLNIDQYAVTGDGQRFIVLNYGDAAPAPITVVLNWQVSLTR